MKLEIPQVLLTQTLQQLSAEPLVLAGRPIERYTIEELQGYAKSGVLAAPVLANVVAELQRRTAESEGPNSAVAAGLAAPGDELDQPSRSSPTSWASMASLQHLQRLARQEVGMKQFIPTLVGNT